MKRPKSFSLSFFTQHDTPSTESEIMTNLADIVPAGVLTGKDVLKLFDHARENNYAIPAVNCTR